MEQDLCEEQYALLSYEDLDNQAWTAYRNEDYVKAFKIHKLLSDKYYTVSMWQIAECYMMGIGVKKDSQKAFDLYEQLIKISINDIEKLKDTITAIEDDERNFGCDIIAFILQRIYTQVADLTKQVTDLTTHIEASPDGELYLKTKSDWGQKK